MKEVWQLLGIVIGYLLIMGFLVLQWGVLCLLLSYGRPGGVNCSEMMMFIGVSGSSVDHSGAHTPPPKPISVCLVIQGLNYSL